MAVFTEVPLVEAQALADRLALGQVTELRGIQAGIENTNYFLTTPRGEFVLTLFERLGMRELPFYLHLMKHLAQRRIPVPEPQADARGELLHQVCGKPAAVVDKLRGEHELQPGVAHCSAVGAMLARMHRAGRDFPLRQPNLRGLAWWRETIPLVLPFLVAGPRAMLEDELQHQVRVAATPAWQALPHGPIHADLFRDNAMFEAERLSGIFDFYFAGIDAFLFDLAVCLNDWCVDLDSGAMDAARASACVDAYESVRPLTAGERTALPDALRAAALRFWTSRLYDLHLPREASLLKAHDPAHFERVLLARRGDAAAPPSWLAEITQAGARP